MLYRSYLWAVAVPGLIAIALTGFKPRTIYTAGIVLALVFGALALERMARSKTTARLGPMQLKKTTRRRQLTL